MKKLLLPILMLVSLITKAQENSFCTYYGQDAKYKKKEICDYLSFNSNADAEKKVDEILAQVGLKKNFVLMECINVNNAIAINLPSQFGQIRYIIYDSKFFKKINPNGKSDWGALAILAHEIAHHLNGHTLSKSGSKPALELEADEFSGFVLSRMGATLNQALSAMQKVGNEEATDTHPAKKDRIAAITKGWNNAQKLSKDKREPTSVSKEILKQKVEPNANKKLASWIGNWRNPQSKAQLVIDTTQNEILIRKITNPKNEKLKVQFVAKNDANYLIQYQEKGLLKKTNSTLIMQSPKSDTIFYVRNNKPNNQQYFIKTIQNPAIQKTKNGKTEKKETSNDNTSNLSIGISVGGLNVSGDVRSRNLFNQAIDPLKTLGLDLSSTLRLFKQNWYLQLNYIHGSASGYNYQPAVGYSIAANRSVDNPWVANGYTGAVYYNYHTKIRALSIMGIYSTGKQHRFSADFGLGISGLLYASFTDVMDGNGGTYQAGFNTIESKQRDEHIFNHRKEIANELKNLFDGTYETPGERHDNRGWGNNYTFRPAVSTSIAFEFKFSKKLSLVLKDQFIFTMDDLVDGQRWQERDAMTRDFDNVNYLGIGLRYNF